MPTVGSILGGAFRLLRDKPLAVAAWGGIYLVLSVFVGLAMRSFMGDLTATAGDPQAALAHMSSIFGLSMLVWLLTAIVYCILLAAVYRAVLRPADTGLGAYLKLGLDEFLLFILLVIFVVVFYIAMLIAAVVIALLAAAIAVGSAGAGAAIAIVLAIALICAMIYFAVRFSLAFPLTVLRGRLIVGESWRLSRGHFWSLFGAYFVLVLMMIVIGSAIALYTAGPYIEALLSGGFMPENLQRAAEAQMALQSGPIGARLVIGWALNAIWATLWIALAGGAAATATKELVVDTDALAQEFA